MGAELKPNWYILFGASQVLSDLPLSELAQIIRCDNAAFQNVADRSQGKIGILILVSCDNGTKDVYCLIKQALTDKSDCYFFSGLCYQLYYDQIENCKDTGSDLVLFP